MARFKTRDTTPSSVGVSRAEPSRPDALAAAQRQPAPATLRAGDGVRDGQVRNELVYARVERRAPWQSRRQRYLLTPPSLVHRATLTTRRPVVAALWPLTLVDTEAIRLVTGEETRSACRNADLLSDSAHLMLSKPGSSYTGQFEIDEFLMRRELGWKAKDFARFATVKDEELLPDLFLPQNCEEEIKALRAQD